MTRQEWWSSCLPEDAADLWGEGVMSTVMDPEVLQSSEAAGLHGHSILREERKSCSSMALSETLLDCEQGRML